MADEIDPARFIIHPDGRIEDTQAPEPPPWKRKHRPEPEQPTADHSPSDNSGCSVLGWKALGVLGGIVLSVIGAVLSTSDRPAAPVAPPAVRDPQAMSDLQRMLDRARPPAVILDEMARRVDGFEPQMTVLERAVSRVRALSNRNAAPDDPDTLELYATLRRVLDDMQDQLAALVPSRLTPDELSRRDQLAQRVENLRCTLALVTGTE